MIIQDINTRPPSIFLMRFFYYWVVLFLLIALFHQQWELALLGFLVIGMVWGVKIWSRLSLRNIQWEPKLRNDRLFPDDFINITIQVQNAKLLPIRIQLRVNLDSRLKAKPDQNYLSKDTWVLWYQSLQLKFKLPACKRGVYAIGPLDIQGGDLLGFFSSGKSSPETYQVVVYPRLKQLSPINLPRNDFFGTPGAKHPVEDPLYQLGTRDYQHLRPARCIHWKASARLNRLQEKLCEPSAQMKVLLVIDVAQFETHKTDAAFEEMLEVAASLAAQMHNRGLAIGLMTNGKTFEEIATILPAGHGSKQLSMILEVLARLEMKATTNIEDVLMSGFGLSAGLSFAHFSLHCEDEMWAIKRAYQMIGLQGAFFIHGPSENPEKKADALHPHTYYLEDICI